MVAVLGKENADGERGYGHEDQRGQGGAGVEGFGGGRPDLCSQRSEACRRQHECYRQLFDRRQKDQRRAGQDAGSHQRKRYP